MISPAIDILSFRIKLEANWNRCATDITCVHLLNLNNNDGYFLTLNFISLFTSDGTHGATNKVVGRRVPAQGSILGCRTNLWPGAQLLLRPNYGSYGIPLVMLGPVMFHCVHLFIIILEEHRTSNRVFISFINIPFIKITSL